jgi:excisionase family DNA binding protein
MLICMPKLNPIAIGEAKPASIDEAIARVIQEQLRSFSLRTKRLYTMSEALEYLAISDDTLYELIAHKAIVPVRFTRRPLFDVDDLDKLIEAYKKCQ